MKKLILIGLSIIYCVTVQAQYNIDSLLNVLNNNDIAPIEKMETYDQICNHYLMADVFNYEQYASEALQFANKLKDKKYTANFTEHLGRSYVLRSINDTALMLYEKALALAIETGDEIREASIYNSFGILYDRSHDFDAALEYYGKSADIYKKPEYKRRYMSVLHNIGRIHRMLSNPDKGLEYSRQVEAIATELDNLKGKLDAFSEIGANYAALGQVDKAIEYQEKALDIARIRGDIGFEASILLMLATNYMRIKEYTKAELCLSDCQVIAEKIADPTLFRDLWITQSNLYRDQRRWKESDKAATKVWNDNDPDNYIAGCNLAFNIALANIYLGNKEKAEEFFWKFDKLTQKLIETRNRQILTEMEVKYESEKKELKIAALEKEKKLSIGLAIAVIAILLLILSLLIIRHRLNLEKRKIAEQQVKQLEQENQLIAAHAALDAETAERARLARDLHDGIGGMLSVVKLNLNDVKGFKVIDGSDIIRFDKALEMLDQSISELRRVAHHMMPESLMRYGLKLSLDDFCRAVPGARFQYLGSDKRLDSRLEVILYRCTYELVNNALKHSQADNINVQLIADEGLVSLTVHDDGIGFDLENTVLGAGLINIRARVSAYNGKMNIYSSPGNGTEITIEIENCYD